MVLETYNRPLDNVYILANPLHIDVRCAPVKIFVTGARGFIGRHVVDHLTRGGHYVSQTDYSLGYGHEIGRVEVPEGTDVVIHLAAVLTPHDDRLLNYVFNTNVRGTLHLLEESLEKGVQRFIFMSSAGVYQCLNLYAASKLAGEAYCRAVSDQIQVKIIRLFNAYGPRQMVKSGALVPSVVDALFNGRPVIITGDGEQTRDFVFVQDVAAVLAREVNDYLLPNGVPVDLGTGIATSVNTVVDTAFQQYRLVTGCEPMSVIEHVPLDGVRQATYSKAEITVPCLPQYTSLEKGLWETTEFWKRVVHRPMPLEVAAHG